MGYKIKNVSGKPAILPSDSGETVDIAPAGSDRAGKKKPKKPIPLVEKPITGKKRKG